MLRMDGASSVSSPNKLVKEPVNEPAIGFERAPSSEVGSSELVVATSSAAACVKLPSDGAAAVLPKSPTDSVSVKPSTTPPPLLRNPSPLSYRLVSEERRGLMRRCRAARAAIGAGLRAAGLSGSPSSLCAPCSPSGKRRSRDGVRSAPSVSVAKMELGRDNIDAPVHELASGAPPLENGLFGRRAEPCRINAGAASCASLSYQGR